MSINILINSYEAFAASLGFFGCELNDSIDKVWTELMKSGELFNWR